MSATTAENSGEARPIVGRGRRPVPGLLLVYSGGEPRHAAWPIGDGDTPGRLVLGRDELLSRGVHDDRVSRQHVLVEYDPAGFVVRDLGSRNGSALDGESLPPNQERRMSRDDGPKVLRIGKTLLLTSHDLRPHEQHRLSVQGGEVIGPVLREVRDRVAMLSRAGHSMLITGESGAGKEHLARVYHAAGPGAAAPFVAINCATIARELAERLLFGARRGAYSGAVSDAEGYVTAAHGGTLFLDEIGELDPAVQAKLLRVLETRQVMPLGATRPHKVEVRLCAATLRDLRGEVEAGRFRQDLFFRIAQPEIQLPPLRERLEEIPWLCQIAVRDSGAPAQDGQRPPISLGLSLVEACLRRPWPGNVRELLAEVRAAALLGLSRGSDEVSGEHLSPRAGLPLGQAPAASPGEPLSEEALRAQEALLSEKGNVKRTAERLGFSRAKLRRLIEKYRLPLGSGGKP